MSLRSQIATLLVVLSITFVALTYAVQVMVVMPAFVVLERQSAEKDVDRSVDAIRRDIVLLSHSVLDWSAWDDCYKYVEDKNDAFSASTLNDEAFQHANVNLIAILEANHKFAWFGIRNLQTQQAIALSELNDLLQTPSPSLNEFEGVEDEHVGIISTKHGPLLFAARPIVTSKNEGPIRGSVIFGRFLDSGEISKIAERTHISLAIHDLSTTDVKERESQYGETVPANGSKIVRLIDAKTLKAFAVMEDHVNKPAILLEVNIQRNITSQGNVSANFATGCSIAGGVLTLLAMWAVLQWRIVGPLQTMASHALRVGNKDDLKARLGFNRSDEIGTLAGEFDAMVGHLAASRKKILDTAHRAGMAEIASEVLHNVGNAVNSANCSVELLDERLSRSKVNGLERAAGMLREHAPHAADFFSKDPRGPKLVDYLVSLNTALQLERSENQTEVIRLRDTVRHIRDAISAQQTFAGKSDFKQEVELSALLDEVLQINQELIRSAEVKVAIELPSLPELQLNKSKMTQVLVNLVRNAIQSMQCVPTDNRRLTIAVHCVDDEGIELEIADSGIGFGEEVRSKLFTHGFTTKTEGNGFGLHYCANAIRESSGHVTAQSPGPGHGATFRIRLPKVLPQPQAAV